MKDFPSNITMSIQNFLVLSKCNILIVTETWLNNNNSHLINLKNYSLILRKNKPGGDIASIIKTNTPHEELAISDNNTSFKHLIVS